MAAGGTVAKTEIEQIICAELAENCVKMAYFLLVLTLLWLPTEINVTSPTGIREIDRLEGTRLGEQVIEWWKVKSSFSLSFEF